MEAVCQVENCPWGHRTSNDLRGSAQTEAKHHHDETSHPVYVYVEQTVYYEADE